MTDPLTPPMDPHGRPKGEFPLGGKARSAKSARMSHDTGLLLFAHGARDPVWARPFEAVAERCRAQRPDMPVALAFLEFIQPDLIRAGAALAEQGCRDVDVVPLFLGAGGHVRKDIPLLMARLQAEHAGVRWTLRTAVGEAPALIEAMAAVALGAAAGAAVPIR